MPHFMPQKSRRCMYQRWYQICFITLTMFFEDTTRSRNFSYGLKVGPAFGPEQSIYQLRQEWIHHTYYFRNNPRHESFLAKSTHCQDTIRREKSPFVSHLDGFSSGSLYPICVLAFIHLISDAMTGNAPYGLERHPTQVLPHCRLHVNTCLSV